MKPQTMPFADAIRIVAAEFAAAEADAGSYEENPQTWHAAHRAAMEKLAERLAEQLGARIVSKWDGTRVRICGIASTSTTGTAGALRNWLAAAAKREAQS